MQIKRAAIALVIAAAAALLVEHRDCGGRKLFVEAGRRRQGSGENKEPAAAAAAPAAAAAASHAKNASAAALQDADSGLTYDPSRKYVAYVCPCQGLGGGPEERFGYRNLSSFASMNTELDPIMADLQACANNDTFHKNFFDSSLTRMITVKSRRVKNRSSSCAIVGNSPRIINLNSSGFGEAIDSHQVIIRFNKALPSGPISKYIGTKETARFGNRQYARELSAGCDDLNICKFPSYGVSMPIRTNSGIDLILNVGYRINRKSAALTRINKKAKYKLHLFGVNEKEWCRKFLLSVKELAKKDCGLELSTSKFKCTSGLFALIRYLPQCKNVTIYGAGVLSKGLYSYAKGDDNQFASINTHSFDTEALIFHAFAKKKNLQLCDHPDPPSCGLQKSQ